MFINELDFKLKAKTCELLKQIPSCPPCHQELLQCSTLSLAAMQLASSVESPTPAAHRSPENPILKMAQEKEYLVRELYTDNFGIHNWDRL